MMDSKMIYLVHDYLIQMGGAERVVATMAKTFPDAPIYTSATHEPGVFEELDGSEVHNTWLQRIPSINRHFKKLFPLYPMAFASLALPDRPVAWISASTFAKCIRPKPGTTTFCYCHNPTRFLWDTETYVGAEVNSGAVKSLIALLLPWLRRVDYAAAQRIDWFVANSENVRKRIAKTYGRESVVIHPPVNVHRHTVEPKNEGYYVLVSRLIGYKRIDLAVQAFSGWNRELRIIGDGTDRRRLEAMADSNVRFLGRVSEDELRRQLGHARALIFPGEEDFGISPVEAQACGKPVVAYGAGGALETVLEGKTGVFFREQGSEALRRAVEECERISWDAEEIRTHAETFSERAFLEKMIAYMEEKLAAKLV